MACQYIVTRGARGVDLICALAASESRSKLRRECVDQASELKAQPGMFGALLSDKKAIHLSIYDQPYVNVMFQSTQVMFKGSTLNGSC